MTERHSTPIFLVIALAIHLAAVETTATQTAAEAVAPTADLPRERISIDREWRFQKGDPPGNTFIKDPARRFTRPKGNPGGDVSYVRRAFDDRAWQKVDLPHDWAIGGPFLTTGPYGGMGRLPSWGIGWYRKKLSLPAEDSGKSVFLDVDGAMSYATVWLNGHLVGGWAYGYASWRVDLTPYLIFGDENQLAIRLDNPPDSSRWYPDGGIYRHGWLTKSGAVHIGHWGATVTTREVTSASATVDLEVAIDNALKASATVRISSRIFALDDEGRKAGDAVASVEPVETLVAAGASATVKGSVVIAGPRLWGPPPNQKPNRYVAVTTISRDGKITDVVDTRFGIRTVRTRNIELTATSAELRSGATIITALAPATQ